MKINELIRKIREERNYSLSEIGEKVGFAKGTIKTVESGQAPMSKNLFEGYVKAFPLMKDILLKSYLKQFIPENMEDLNIENISNDINVAEIYSIKVYDYLTSGNGKIDLNKYEKLEFPLDKKDKEIIVDNSIVFKVLGNNLEPRIIENDIIYFSKIDFDGWETLDRSLVLVTIDGEYYIRKISYTKGKPYLISFNENVYTEIEINDKIKFIGLLGGLLQRYANEIKF